MATRHEGEPPLNRPVANTRSLKLPATLLGLGLGGFVDGILLHQVLQWHHMRTGDGILGHRSMKTIGGLEANTLADGLFHLATWALTVIGLFWLWRIVREGDGMRSWSELVGLVLTGWGIFNLVEGVVDHHILGIHHVRDDIGAPLGWDLGFLAFGAVMVAVGFRLYRRHEAPELARSRSR
jgi:uncharacterized membrane protein